MLRGVSMPAKTHPRPTFKQLSASSGTALAVTDLLYIITVYEPSIEYLTPCPPPNRN